MKVLFFLVILMNTTLISVVAHAQDRWMIEDDYQVSFDGRGAEGTFRGLSGKIVFDPENLDASSFEVTLDPSTIDTGNDTKDKHARGDSWFDVRKYTKITFRSMSIVRQKENEGFIANGRLTLHGTTLETQINFEFEKEAPVPGVEPGPPL